MEPKEEVVKLQSFSFWYLPIERLLHSASKKIPESAGGSGVFPYLRFILVFCCAKPGLWIKTKFGSPFIPWNEPLSTKKDGITMELYGKDKKFPVPYRVTCRPKTVKSVSIENPRRPSRRPSWKSLLNVFSWTERSVASKPGMKYQGDLQVKNS